MKTPEEILEQMRIEMPFHLPDRIKPYIAEAMKLYANQKLDEAAESAFNHYKPSGMTNLAERAKQSILALKNEI